MAAATRCVYLRTRPQGALENGHFELGETALSPPGRGEAQVRTLYISIDASNRFWMHGSSAYHAVAETGEVMSGRVLGRVESCPGGELEAGALVVGDWGWRERATVRVRALQPAPLLPEGLPLSYLMTLLGISGLTGYFGMLEVGRARAGDTVVVSAAAGAAGSMAAQIATIAGCRVIGIAGSDEKCAWLTGELGLAGAVNYKKDLAGGLDAALPDGADVYFDNVGGGVLEAMLPRVVLHGRIVCCGAVALYDSPSVSASPAGIPGLVVTRRLTMRGFIVLDFASQFAVAQARMARWVREGRLVVREDILDGLENAPRALIGLLGGDNTGKRLVRLTDEK